MHARRSSQVCALDCNSGTLRLRLVITAGLGGMGDVQPLAATMKEGTFLAAGVDPTRIDFRLRTRYLDVCIDDLDDATDQALARKHEGVAKSIGVP